MSPLPPRECQWEVEGLTLRGLEWGVPGDRPVLALHGWQDNAGSFLQLAPQLGACHLVALDLTGHGRSSFRSADAGYQIWDDLPQLLGVLDALGWERFALLGHSRGGIIATLLASTQPDRVSHLVLLDSIAPQAVPEGAFPRQLAEFLRDRKAAASATARRYPTRDAAIEARARRGLSREGARALAERGLVGDDLAGWQWRIDPRLRGASAVKMSESNIRAVLGAVRAPALLLQAKRGLMHSHPMAEIARDYLSSLRVEQVDGGHHFHLEPAVDQWIDLIRSFLETQ